MKIQSMKGLIGEMRAVARGEVAPPADAALPSVESAEAADSDEAGHAFQSEAGHLFRREAGRGSDLKPVTFGVVPLGRLE